VSAAVIEARPRELVELLRRARVEGRAIALRAPPGSDAAVVRVVAGRDATVALDGHNSIAEIDGALTLSSAARRLERLGAVFPIARPLPPIALSVACAALPWFVDAFVQQANALTLDGDPFETPRAPRAAAGPSLLAALCSRPPLALAVHARVRVALASQSRVAKEEHGDIRAAAQRVRHLVEAGRAFAVDAHRSSVLVVGGEGAPAARPGSKFERGAFKHEGRGRAASFTRSTSLNPGDVDAIEDALAKGARVAGAPFMGRLAALWRGFEAIPVVEVEQGVRSIVAALETSP
jgi:hypothetical protein